MMTLVNCPQRSFRKFEFVQENAKFTESPMWSTKPGRRQRRETVNPERLAAWGAPPTVTRDGRHETVGSHGHDSPAPPTPAPLTLPPPGPCLGSASPGSQVRPRPGLPASRWMHAADASPQLQGPRERWFSFLMGLVGGQERGWVKHPGRSGPKGPGPSPGVQPCQEHR